jgi:hypothetical protein
MYTNSTTKMFAGNSTIEPGLIVISGVNPTYSVPARKPAR